MSTRTPEDFRKQYDLRERFLLGLERAKESFDKGDVEAARGYVEFALDLDNVETDRALRVLYREEEEPEEESAAQDAFAAWVAERMA